MLPTTFYKNLKNQLNQPQVIFQHGCVMRQPWDCRQNITIRRHWIYPPPSNVAIENKNKQNKLAKKPWWCYRPNKNKSQQTARKNNLLRSFSPWMKHMRSRQIGFHFPRVFGVKIQKIFEVSPPVRHRFKFSPHVFNHFSRYSIVPTLPPRAIFHTFSKFLRQWTPKPAWKQADCQGQKIRATKNGRFFFQFSHTPLLLGNKS